MRTRHDKIMLVIWSKAKKLLTIFTFFYVYTQWYCELVNIYTKTVLNYDLTQNFNMCSKIE